MMSGKVVWTLFGARTKKEPRIAIRSAWATDVGGGLRPLFPVSEQKDQIGGSHGAVAIEIRGTGAAVIACPPGAEQ